ncbi:MAG: lipoate--protein ligase [bacterium]
MLIVESTRLDACYNLALEDYLLDEVERRGRILCLYCNSDAVVIGKNQNPWRECDVRRLRAEGVALARRVSGGGAVYHDEGNLNFSIMLPRHEYDPAGPFRTVQAALLRAGIASARTGTHSLTMAGRKFSGNAFCLRRNTSLHHGTLLIHSDLVRLARCLTPGLPGMETKAIPSVPAQVMNLREIKPSLTREELSGALAAEFTERYGGGERITDRDVDAAALAPYEAKMRTWEWIYGHTPRFEVDVAGRGRLVIEDGLVKGTGQRFDV